MPRSFLLLALVICPAMGHAAPMVCHVQIRAADPIHVILVDPKARRVADGAVTFQGVNASATLPNLAYFAERRDARLTWGAVRSDTGVEYFAYALDAFSHVITWRVSGGLDQVVGSCDDVSG